MAEIFAGMAVLLAIGICALSIYDTKFINSLEIEVATANIEIAELTTRNGELTEESAEYLAAITNFGLICIQSGTFTVRNVTYLCAAVQKITNPPIPKIKRQEI